MSSETAIKVDNITKCYQIYDQPRDRLKQFVLPHLQRLFGLKPKNYFREFWALREVSFEIKKGETAGIIGRNGSGKSTLLQIVCGILNPTSGSIQTNGRIAALLELGSGFNPEFTGRENVYLGASLYGLTQQEIDSRFEKIVSFSEISEFIDQPVKTYSSGMFVRLAFSLAAHVDADILVIDEALAVGDVFFQQKCMRFLRNFQEAGGSILFVSHDSGAVLSLCKKALLLFSGAKKPPKFGKAEDLCQTYLEEIYGDPTRKVKLGGTNNKSELKNSTEKDRGKHKSFSAGLIQETLYSISAFRPDAESFGVGGATIFYANFIDEHEQTLQSIRGDEIVRLRIKAKVHSRIAWAAFGFMLKNSLGENLFTEGTDLPFRPHEIVLEGGDIVFATFTFIMPHLNRGNYTISVAFAEGIGDDHIQHHWIHDAVEISALTSRLAHGYSGMNCIQMNIDINPELSSEI